MCKLLSVHKKSASYALGYQNSIYIDHKIIYIICNNEPHIPDHLCLVRMVDLAIYAIIIRNNFS